MEQCPGYGAMLQMQNYASDKESKSQELNAVPRLGMVAMRPEYVQGCPRGGLA